MWQVPIAVGYIPVMIEDREGAQTPYTLKALVYREPSVASLSRLGVLAYRSP
jgi:hypothetical protein